MNIPGFFYKTLKKSQETVQQPGIIKSQIYLEFIHSLPIIRIIRLEI